MKKNLAKTLALLLAVMFITSLIACKPATPEPGTTTQEASSTAEGKEPVTLTYYGWLTGIYTSGVQDDPIALEIAKKTGVTIDWDFHPSDEKFSAMLASGDLPDIMSIDTTVKAYSPKDLIATNYFVDLAPLLNTNGQTLLAECPEKLAYTKEVLGGSEKKLYFIQGPDGGMVPPAPNYFIANGFGMMIRWDYYKELGYPEVKDSIDDVIPILKEIMKRHPTNADGKKAYGVSPWFKDWNLWNFTVWHQAWKNCLGERESFLDMDCKTNECTPQLTDTNSSLWQGVKYYNKCHQAGIMDPDCVTQTYDNFVEKINSNRVYFHTVDWAVASYEAIAGKAGHPEQGFMPIKLPDKITKFYSGWHSAISGRGLTGITTKCEYPDRAMDFLNFIGSIEGTRLMYNGIQGKDWEVVNGKPQRTEALQQMISSDPDYPEKTGITKYNNAILRFGTLVDPEYNCPINFALNQDYVAKAKSSPLWSDYCEHYGVSFPGEVFIKLLTDNAPVLGGFTSFAESTSAEIKLIDGKLMNYLNVNMIKCMLTNSDAEFEAMQKKIIEDCKSMGCEQSFEHHKKRWADAVKKRDSIDLNALRN